MFPTQSGNEMSDCQSNLSRRFKQVQMNCYQTKINTQNKFLYQLINLFNAELDLVVDTMSRTLVIKFFI